MKISRERKEWKNVIIYVTGVDIRITEMIIFRASLFNYHYSRSVIFTFAIK